MHGVTRCSRPSVPDMIAKDSRFVKEHRVYDPACLHDADHVAMTKSRSAAQAVACSAIENVRLREVARDELIAALSSGAGEPTILRTLFGDVSLLTILRLGYRTRT